MSSPFKAGLQDEDSELITLTRRQYRRQIWGARFDGFVVGVTVTFLIVLGLIVWLRL